MKKITNTSMQGILLTFFTSEGEKNYFLKPKATVVVPVAYNSIVLDNLLKRRILKVQIIQDTSVSVNVIPEKQITKIKK